MNQGYDNKSVRRVFSKAFGAACHLLKIKLNEGFDPEFEDTYDFNFGKPENILDEAIRSQALQENARKFEDDVMAYLIVAAMNYGKSDPSSLTQILRSRETDLFALINSAKLPRKKAFILRSNADFGLFGTASGVIPDTDEAREFSASCYNRAAGFYAQVEGRTSARAQLMDKLGFRFHRYHEITREVFGESLTKINPEEPEVGISKEATIDELLEQLGTATDEATKKRIIADIKRVSGVDEGHIFH